MKSILYLTYDGLTDPLGQSQILPYITELSKRGFSFSIISFEKKEAAYSESEISEQIAAFNIDWYPLTYTKKPPVLSTFWDIIRLSQKVRLILKEKDVALIHCRSYITSLIGLQMKKKNNIPFVFDMRGFWADERVDGGIWKLKNPIFNLVYGYFKQKEKEFIERSAHIVSLTHSGRDEMLRWGFPNVEQSKFTIIPCAADFDVFHLQTAENRIASRKGLNIKESTFILSYVGSTGTWYQLEDMLMFFRFLKSRISNAKFLFITKDNSNDIIQKAQKLELSASDLIFRSANRTQVNQFLDASDLSIFFIKPLYSKKASSPTKQGEIMAKGIPYIANVGVGDVERIVKETNSGVLVDSSKKETFDKAIDEFFKSSFDKIAIRENAKSLFDLKNAVGTYQKIYIDILD